MARITEQLNHQEDVFWGTPQTPERAALVAQTGDLFDNSNRIVAGILRANGSMVAPVVAAEVPVVSLARFGAADEYHEDIDEKEKDVWEQFGAEEYKKVLAEVTQSAGEAALVGAQVEHQEV